MSGNCTLHPEQRLHLSLAVDMLNGREPLMGLQGNDLSRVITMYAGSAFLLFVFD